MSEQTNELTKLSEIARDMQLPRNMREKAIDQLGNIYSHEALLALLEIAANENLTNSDRDRALKQARNVVKKTSPQ